MVKRIKTSVIDGAAAAAMPGFIKLQLATLKLKAPKGPHWLHEIKFDGYRVQIHLNQGKRKVFTRKPGLDQTVLGHRRCPQSSRSSDHRR